MTRTKLPIRDICITGIFTALTAVLAQIAIPLPFTPVPISFGLVAVYITGMLLTPRNAVFAQVCYLLLGAAGLPVFGNFRGGLAALFGPTGGYLIVYPLMALLVSFALNRGGIHPTASAREKAALYGRGTLAICAAHLLLYLGGSLWLSVTTGNTLLGAMALAVFPFIPVDVIKIVFCITGVLPLRERLIRMNLLTGAPAEAVSAKKTDGRG